MRWIVLLLALPAFGATPVVTWGWAYTTATTATTTTSSNQIVTTGQPAGDQQFEPNQLILIGGGVGYKIVTVVANSGNPATTSSTLTLVNSDWSAWTASGNASSLSMTLIADNIDHAAARIFFRTDISAYTAVAFDTITHTSSDDYTYRTIETNGAGRDHALNVVGLKPGTLWRFRPNAKDTSGTDNSTACKVDACGATEITITTPADTHTAEGRPPQPTAPTPVAAHVVTPPDTSGYTVYNVPPWTDGSVTGTVNAGSTTLTVSSVPAGMSAAYAVGELWIYMPGGACRYYVMTHAGGAYAPWCRITNISGTTLTLANAADVSLSNVAVNFALITISRLLFTNAVGYGTVFEFAQGYRGYWNATDSNQQSDDGILLPGLPLDPGAASIGDSAHKWIVFRTSATPGSLPPVGTRTGPEYDSVLGGIEPVPGGTRAVIRLSEWCESDMPAHHYRFENLAIVGASSSPTDGDPYPYPVAVKMGSGSCGSKYVAIDRVYSATPNVYTRGGHILALGGSHIAIVGSYSKSEYWRPWTDDMVVAPSSNTIAITSMAFQRNSSETLVTQGAATVTASGTASGDVTIVGAMDASAGNGVEIRYTSGAGITLTCPACRVVTATATPMAVAATSNIFFTVYISNGGSTIWDNGNSYKAGSLWNPEGFNAVEALEGGIWLVENNYLEAYNKGVFIDVTGLPSWTNQPPSDVVIRRNTFYMGQEYRSTSGTSNGYRYLVRHELFECKRCRRILIEGNIVSGGWRSLNEGAPFNISNTFTSSPVNSAISDVEVRHNRVFNVAAGWYTNPHYLTYMQSAIIRRVYVHNNLMYDFDAWRQSTRNTNGGWGKQSWFLGEDMIFEHNTTYDAKSNMPVFTLCGDHFEEGHWMANNIWTANTSAHGYLAAFMDFSGGGLPRKPAISTSEFYTGANFDTGMGSCVFRVDGATVASSFTFRNNAIICGELTYDGTAYTDITSSCATYAAKFGTWQSLNYFASGASKTARTAAMKWASTTNSDFRWQPSAPYVGALQTTDGKTIGADVDLIDSASGVIKNLTVRDIRSAGSIGCAGSVGTHCVTFTALVPDRAASCRVVYGAHGSDITGWTATSDDTATTAARSITISGLADGSWDWRYQCVGHPPVATQEFTL